MSGFDFFVDLTVTGTALGLDHTSTPEAVRAVFHDRGLVEFGVHGHTVTYFGAQVHRLPLLVRDDMIEPVLVERYGGFPNRVDVDELRKIVAEQGFSLEEQPCDDEDYVYYWSPVSHMSVLAERSSRDVVKLLGPSYRSFLEQLDRFKAYATHLLGLSDAERETWFDKRAEPDADWWDCLAAAAALKTGGTAESAHRWALLRLALHQAATRREVYRADQAAATEVRLLLACDHAPDDAVRRWLAIAVMPAPSDIAAARRLRDQIHEVSRALPRLTDPEVAARLREWVTVKPQLLAA